MRMCLKNPKKSRRKCPSRKIAREFSYLRKRRV